MAAQGAGVAKFSEEIDKFLTDNVGEAVIAFEKSGMTEFINGWADTWRKSLETAKRGQYTGHIASGNLYQSLLDGWEFTTLGKQFRIQLVLPDYYQFTDKGRNASSGSGNGALRKALAFGGKGGGWIAQRKLVPSGGMTFTGKYKLKNGTVKTYTRKLNAADSNKALSFMISKKIHENGYEGSNWFSKYIKRFEDELGAFMEKEFGKGIRFNLEIFGKK